LAGDQPIKQHEAAILRPAKKQVAGRQIGSERIRVADIRREEFDIAPGGFVAEIGDERSMSGRPRSVR
jgi:hypothetical protein